MKRTLDQIRAAVAMRYKNKIGGGAEGGEKIKGFPTIVQINGLLGALAYACERKKDKDTNQMVIKNTAEYNLCRAIVAHLNELREEGYQVLPEYIDTPETLAETLSGCTRTEFRRVNAEVLAFLNYLRRFAS